MKRKWMWLFHSHFICLLILCSAVTLWAQNDDVLTRKIKMPKEKGTVYQLLMKVSEYSGYQFIYNSKIIDNNKAAKLSKGTYTIHNAVNIITGNNQLKLRVVGKHIVLSLAAEKSKEPQQNQQLLAKSEDTFITIEGILRDPVMNEVIPFASINIDSTSVGTVSNLDGYFKLKVPSSFSQSKIKFSHVGYHTQEVDICILAGQFIALTLNPQVVSLQEVVVRVSDPLKILQEMLLNLDKNYSSKSAYLTTFYREGVEYKKKNIDLTEAVFNVYKTSYKNSTFNDQVKMVKMRRIISEKESSLLSTKIKSGIDACLLLDLIKSTPDFFGLKNVDYYRFNHTDITNFDDRTVNVISFEQHRYINDPLYRGKLYIDADNHALLHAEFEIQPQYVEKMAGSIIVRQSKNIKLTPTKIVYIVSYKPVNGIYYINHVRGDLYFKTKFKNNPFSSETHTWFEMVTCEVNTSNVSTFSRKERISTQTVFSEMKYAYDDNFWTNFNVIMPEYKLREAVSSNLSKGSEVSINETED